MIKLESSDGSCVENPSEEQIVGAVERLKTGDSAILSDCSREDDLIQVLGQGKLVILGYHNTRTNRLLRSRKSLRRNEAVKLLIAYLRGETSYRQSTKWKDITHIFNRPMSLKAMRVYAVASILMFAATSSVPLANKTGALSLS